MIKTCFRLGKDAGNLRHLRLDIYATLKNGEGVSLIYLT
jgi:hypothetical protein